MNVTMIYCGIGVSGFNSDRPLGDREGSWVGHGIASVAACAKQAGHNVKLIDMRQLSGWPDFEQKIASNRSSVFGVSISPVDYKNALKAILIIKKAHPEAKVVIGGISPTIFPEDYNFRAIDCIITGEGEISFCDVLSDIEAGRPIERIIKGKKPILDEIPFVARDMFEYERELNCFFAPGQKTPSITMLAGRGCPYKCTYCQPAENAVFGNPFRIRSVENVIEELKELHRKYKYKSITFWDDTFTISKKWVMDFCDAYEATGIGATIAACSRADIICRHPEIAQRLASVGLDWFVIGLESGSQRILDLIKKGTTVQQNIEAANICRANGIKIFGTYMYGLPTENEEDSLATAKMIDEIQPEHPSPFWFLPIKGTEIYDYCVQNDLILSETNKRTIERTCHYEPTIKNVNYDYIQKLMQGHREKYAPCGKAV